MRAIASRRQAFPLSGGTPCTTTKKDACNRLDTCVARTVWVEVNHAIEKAMKGISLADVLHRCGDCAEADNYMI